MKHLIFIKGIIIGIAKIIPGLSGAVLMISFHLYDKAINAITNFFNAPKKNFWFLLELGLGIVIGIVLFSKVVLYFLTHYYLYTTVFFIGLIMGGIPVVTNEFSKSGKNIILIIISFLFVTILSISNLNYNYTIHHSFVDLVIFFLSGPYNLALAFPKLID